MIMEDTQVLYLGRWVSKNHFKAFVYNKEGQKLARSYAEYSELISSGLWQAEPLNDIKDLGSENINFEKEELKESTEIDESNIVEIKPKRGRKCRNQKKP